MEKFEYKIRSVRFEEDLEDVLNEDGEDGWDLVRIQECPAEYSDVTEKLLYKRRVVE
jgi:hypothetical protein